MPTGKRSWTGTTLTDRKATRRDLLLDAGIALLGDEEGSAVSVRAACRRAGLTERYFYESFTDRDAFVLAVYEHVAEQAHRTLVEAIPDSAGDPESRADAAVTAFVSLMLDNPDKGRVLLLAPTSDSTLSTRGVALLPAFAALVREQLPPRTDELDREMTAIGLVGALTNLFIAYLNGTLDVTREHLVAHCVRLLIRSAAART